MSIAIKTADGIQDKMEEMLLFFSKGVRKVPVIVEGDKIAIG